MSKEWKTAHLFGLEANTVSVGRHRTLCLSHTDLPMNHVLRKGVCLCQAGGAKEVGRQPRQSKREAVAERRAGQKSNWGTVVGFCSPEAQGGGGGAQPPLPGGQQLRTMAQDAREDPHSTASSIRPCRCEVHSPFLFSLIPIYIKLFVHISQ